MLIDIGDIYQLEPKSKTYNGTNIVAIIYDTEMLLDINHENVVPIYIDTNNYDNQIHVCLSDSYNMGKNLVAVIDMKKTINVLRLFKKLGRLNDNDKENIKNALDEVHRRNNPFEIEKFLEMANYIITVNEAIKNNANPIDYDIFEPFTFRQAKAITYARLVEYCKLHKRDYKELLKEYNLDIELK